MMTESAGMTQVLITVYWAQRSGVQRILHTVVTKDAPTAQQQIQLDERDDPCVVIMPARGICAYSQSDYHRIVRRIADGSQLPHADGWQYPASIADLLGPLAWRKSFNDDTESDDSHSMSSQHAMGLRLQPFGVKPRNVAVPGIIIKNTPFAHCQGASFVIAVNVPKLQRHHLVIKCFVPCI
jgi:hypothetical protein